MLIPSYELDFFGRVRSLTSSALSNYLGTREARDSAHIALVAESGACLRGTAGGERPDAHLEPGAEVTREAY